MGCIIDACEYSQNQYLETPICYSAKALFIVNLFFFMKVIQQIFLFHKKKDRYITRKLVLFYLLLTEITANTLYTGIRAWIQLYLIDIVFRHFVFVYLIYYFGRKLMNLLENATNLQKNSPKVLAIVSSLFFFAVLLYGLVDNSEAGNMNACKDYYWVYLRVGGIIMIFFFIILGVILIHRHQESYESVPEFTMIIKYSVSENPSYNEVEKSLIEKNIENMLYKDEKNYGVWMIMGAHFFSALLSLTTTIYISITVEASSKVCGFNPFDKDLTNDITMVTILGWALSLINYFIPLIIILKVFHYKEIKLPVKKPKEQSFSDEDYPYEHNLRVQAHDQRLNWIQNASPKSSSSSMNVDFENSSKKSLLEQNEERNKNEEDEEEEKKECKEETRSSGIL